MRLGRRMEARGQLFTGNSVGFKQEKPVVAAVGDIADRVFHGPRGTPLLEIPGREGRDFRGRADFLLLCVYVSVSVRLWGWGGRSCVPL